MSTTNNLPTRQQLEEIDALLKRMLSLPPLAGEAAEPLTPTPAPTETPTAYAEPRIQSWRVEWPAPAAPASTPSPGPAPVPGPAAATVAAWGSPVTPMPTPPAHRFQVYTPPVSAPAAETQHRPYVSPPFSPAYPPGYAPQDYPQTPVPAALPGPSVITQQPPARATLAPGRSPWLFPLVALNWVYDILTYLMPMGSWLRTGGRVWMGRAAILMFLVSAGWAGGEWYGVEWPKPDLSRINLSRFEWAK